MNLPSEQLAIQYVFPVFSLIIIVGIVVLTQLDRLPASLCRWKIIRGLLHLSNDVKSLFTNKKAILKSLFYGLMGNVITCLLAYQCAQSLNIQLDFLQSLVLIPPTILIATLPISIAGWGVRETAMVTTLSMAGIAETDAFTLSILFGLLVALFSLPGGLISLLHRNDPLSIN